MKGKILNGTSSRDRSLVVPPTQFSMAPLFENDLFTVTFPRLNTLLTTAFGASLTMDPQLVHCDFPPSTRRAPTNMTSSSAYDMTSSTSPSRTAATAQGKTDPAPTSLLGVTALREETSSGSDHTQGLHPTASPAPISFLAPCWAKQLYAAF